MQNVFKRLLAAGGIAIGSMAGTAAAQQTGLYLGGSAGMTSVDVCDDLSGLGLTDCDDSDIGLKLFGGYRINQNFAAEVGFIDLGEVTVSGPGGSGSVESDGIQFAGVGIIPVNPQFDVFGKLGFFMWDVSASGPGGTADDDGTDLMFGVGAAWKFSPQLAARAEWERFDLDGDDVDFLSIGLQFNF